MKYLEAATERLDQQKIPYLVQVVNENKANIYFGKEECVRIIRSFGKDNLSEFSDEEDFILGIMLGYDRMQECERYIKRKAINKEILANLN
jgi:hypothetical protein